MDLGDEELNFRPEVAEEWADEFPRARRVHGPAARPSEEELAGVHFALLMFALLLLVGVAIMTMIGECHKDPEKPIQPAAPSVTQSQVRTQVQETRSAPNAPPVPLPAAEPGATQLPATVFASRLVHVPALPGETEGMNIEVDTKSEDGSLSLVGAPPPGMDLAFLGGAEIREAPDGELAGLAPKGAQFIYRIQMYAQPCWRWLVSLDGEYEGYACFYTVHDQQNESTTQPEEEYLPDGWGVGILTSEMVVRDSPDGD